MSVDAAPTPTRLRSPSRDPLLPAVSGGWLVGPWFDLLFVANIGWPILLLWQFQEGFEGRAGLQFWQVYFVTTPHRWITLALVWGDRQHLRQRRTSLLLITATVVALCCSIRATTGTLTCLLALDYVWNAWHFAAQHHGVFRIYERRTNPRRQRGLRLEKWTMRFFLLYVIFRVAGTTWGHPDLETVLQAVDGPMFVIAVVLMAAHLWNWRATSAAGLIYLGSVLGLYGTLLLAIHSQQPGLALALTTASALFHAIEYLAISSWATHQQSLRHAGELGVMHWFVARWSVALTMFVVVLGAGGWWLDRYWLEGWLLLNVMAAFLHYAYDGLIWCSPRSVTQPVLTGSVP